MAPITPTLDPIPDVYDEDQIPSPGSKYITDSFKTLSLEDYGRTKPLIQMPQPRHIPQYYHSPATMLNSIRSVTPPKIGSSHRLRSTSSNPSLTAPLITRANSSPIVFTHSSPRSASPMRSPKRVRSPLRHASADDIYTMSSAGIAMSPEISSISEDAELEITPRSRHSSMSSLSLTSTASLGFSRTLKRRAHSPMRSIRASSVPASPIKPGRYNESFPPDLTYSRSFSLASSSMPSTPTSVRSRSPSISSLETIPDTPDAERLAAEEDNRDRESRSRMWELYGASTSQAGAGGARGGGAGFGGRDKRKRWSVCGAEKRSDLNLETIWED
jgi:hypothetical protein